MPYVVVSFMNLHAVKTGWLLFSSGRASRFLRAAKHIAHKFSRETLLDNFRLFCHAALAAASVLSLSLHPPDATPDRASEEVGK